MKTPNEDSAFLCIDCQADTLRTWEYYMVHSRVWLEAVPENQGAGMLCIGCLEKRLGRRTNREDFTDCPLNVEMENKPRSLRLAHRLGIVGAVIQVVVQEAPSAPAMKPGQPEPIPMITIENTEYAHMQADGKAGIVPCEWLNRGIEEARNLKT